MSNDLVIGTLRGSESKSGKKTWRFKVHYDTPGELDSNGEETVMTIRPGDNATKWTGATDSYINDIERETLEDGQTVFLNITAVPFAYLENTKPSANSTDKTKQIVKRYEYRQVFFPMEWFGVKLADSTDVTLGKIVVATGSACTKEGELVYKGDGQTAPDYTLCPYDSMPTEAAEIVALIESRIGTIVYVLDFYKKDTMQNVSQFAGVNPEGDFGDEEDFTPFSDATHCWKAIDQKILECQELENSTVVFYLHLERVFEYAPGATLHWKKDKNGGEWSW